MPPLHAEQFTWLTQRSQDRQITMDARNKIRNTEVLEILQSISLPEQEVRANVRPDNQPKIVSIALGLVHDYATGPALSRSAQEWPMLTKLLTAYFRQRHGQFRFTTIQLNKSFASQLHVDTRNEGPSWIIALGDFSGGQLFVADGNGDDYVRVTRPVTGRPDIVVGSFLRGRKVNIRHRWFFFDGNVPHMTTPYRGERYSLVFYRFGFRSRIPERIEVALKALGFHP